jgi:hypothetical protein
VDNDARYILMMDDNWEADMNLDEENARQLEIERAQQKSA